MNNQPPKGIKFMFLCNRLEDTIQTPGVLGGNLAECRVAGHPASTGPDLETVEPAVHVFKLEVFPIESLKISALLIEQS